jgi:flagellar protein FliS
MYPRTALRQYQQVNAQAVVDASPYKVITLLMQGALDRMASAKACISQKDIEGRNRYIGKAVDIIDCLKESLNHKHDAEMTRNLDSLYDYMSRQLFVANASNDPAVIDEVAQLLGTIFDGWKMLEKSMSDAGVSHADPVQHTSAMK